MLTVGKARGLVSPAGYGRGSHNRCAGKDDLAAALADSAPAARPLTIAFLTVTIAFGGCRPVTGLQATSARTPRIPVTSCPLSLAG